MGARRLLVLAAGFVLVVWGLFQFRDGLTELFPALGGGGDKEVSASARAAQSAADAFVALAKDSAHSGSAPRPSDQTAAPLLDKVLNVGTLKAKASLGPADLGALGDWSAASTKVGVVYILAGTGVTDLAAAANDPKVVTQVDRNTATFAPELGRYMDSQLVLDAAVAVVVGADKTGAKAGLDKIQSGIFQTVTGVITTFTVDGIDATWRLGRLDTLLTVAPKIGTILSKDQCAAIRATADRVGQQLTQQAARSQLKAFDVNLTC